MKNEGLLIILSGPSGAGKGTIYDGVLHKMPNIKKSISVTTRAPRTGEVDGVHYYFKSIEQYQKMIAKGEFLETASVFTNYYGTPKEHVFNMLAQGHDVMFDIDVQGAKQIKARYPEAVSIFIMTPGFDVLEQRLRNRNTETENAIKTRLGGARNELSQYKIFDYIVFNDVAEEAVESVVSIITSEKHKISRNAEYVETLLKS